MARTAGASPRATRKAEEEDRLERTKVDLQEKARSGAQDVSVTLSESTNAEYPRHRRPLAVSESEKDKAEGPAQTP